MIDRTEIETLEVADNALMEVAVDIKPLDYAEPVNSINEKRAFLDGEIRNPIFIYRALEYDPADVEMKLLRIQIPETRLGRILDRNRKNALLENRVIANRGDYDLVQAATKEIHGAPDLKLVEYAKGLLEALPTQVSVKDVPACKVKEALEASFRSYGFEWTVELADKWLTNSNSRLRNMSVCRNRLFSQLDLSRLPVHEIGVHVLRTMNGYEQPLGMFALALPGYLPTEEGLTSFFEEKTGNTDFETQRSYAGRVVAVDSVCQGLDFRATYDRLRDNKFSEEEAWGLSLRVHRAGGYIKDHVYLDGYLKVKGFIDAGGDVKKLYVGKVGLDDLPLVNDLLDEEFLKLPKYLPDFLEE